MCAGSLEPVGTEGTLGVIQAYRQNTGQEGKQFKLKRPRLHGACRSLLHKTKSTLPAAAIKTGEVEGGGPQGGGINAPTDKRRVSSLRLGGTTHE